MPCDACSPAVRLAFELWLPSLRQWVTVDEPSAVFFSGRGGRVRGTATTESRTGGTPVSRISLPTGPGRTPSAPGPA